MQDFKELYDIYYKNLFNYLLYITSNKDLAEELMQETFYQAFTSLHRFKGHSSVKTWLFQIAKNVYYKELNRNSTYKNKPIETYIEKLLHNNTPEKELEKKEEQHLLLSQLEKLKDPYKQVIILRSFSELSFKEIGEVYEKSENWARVTFHRGKLQLFEMMKERKDEYE